ncbi:MAG: hypothetical protein OEY41_05070 [Acidimicrobiia bacterium]|nr:hypothetical protein [Acidimicrobiia bacterium]
MAKLRKLSPAIEAGYGITVERMLDGSIHRFHWNQARVEEILAGHAFPREATIEFGPIRLRTSVEVLVLEGVNSSLDVPFLGWLSPLIRPSRAVLRRVTNEAVIAVPVSVA